MDIKPTTRKVWAYLKSISFKSYIMDPEMEDRERAEGKIGPYASPVTGADLLIMLMGTISFICGWSMLLWLVWG